MVKTFSKRTDGKKKISENFLVNEFACKDGSDIILISTELVGILQNIRDHFGKAVVINSAYRNATYNKKIGGVSNSQHVKGTAADICVMNIAPLKVAQYAEHLMPYSGGIGLYSNFVHIDVREKRSRWENYGTEKTVPGFPGYPADKPESAKYHIEGLTHIVEIDPQNIWNVETQCSAMNIIYNNFVNSVFFMPQANGVMFPQGIVVNAGEVMSNYATHDKPVATLIIRGKDDVTLKYVSDITKEKDVWFAVSGYGIYPKITAETEGFVDQYSDVTKNANRPIIGYRKKDNKIVIAVRRSSTAERAHQTAKNLNLDFAISLDGGGSTALKINGNYKFKGDGRILWGGITWR